MLGIILNEDIRAILFIFKRLQVSSVNSSMYFEKRSGGRGSQYIVRCSEETLIVIID